MPKHYPVNEAPASLEPVDSSDALPATSAESDTKPTFWLLKSAQARKLGKKSEGKISYELLADTDRQQLFIAITANEQGGYFSKEKVAFLKVRQCLSNFPNKGFPSKELRDSFVGRSSNNPGFLAAVLSAEGLIAADATTESLHKAIGDWTAWDQAMLALPGILLEIEPAPALAVATDAGAIPDHTPAADTKKAPSTKTRKSGKQPAEASDAGDTPSE